MCLPNNLASLIAFCVIRRLSDSLAEFFEPFSFVLAMNYAAKEPERFGNIVAVEPDLLTGRLGILPHPLLGVRGLGEDVGRMSGLRNLNDYRFLKIEYVFIAEHVHRPRELGELLV